MKKKVISIVLCAGLCTALLAGCGSSSDSASADTAAAEEAGEAADEEVEPDAAAEEIVEEAADEAEPEAEESEETETAEINVDDIDEMTITAVTSYDQNNQIGMMLTAFLDYLEENSGGKVTATPYYGGTFCTGPEELEYVSNGSIDVSVTGAAYAVEHLPLAASSIISADGYEGVVDAGKEIYFNNEETSVALEKEASAYNLKALTTTTAFNIGIWSKNEGGSWEALGANNSLGGAAYATTFQALGINSQTIQMTDLYESLSRGIITAASLGLYNGYAAGLNELCDYVTIGNGAASAPQIYMNLDTFNSMSEATQQLFLDAADYAAYYLADLLTEGDQELIETLGEEGITVQQLSEEDEKLYMEKAYIGNYNSYVSYAEANGMLDEFNALYEFDLDYIGSDLTLEDLQAGL